MFVKQKRKIFAPFIILTSFVCFGTLPYVFQRIFNNEKYINVWYIADGISNAIIFTFINKTITTQIRKTLRNWKENITCKRNI